MCVRRDDRRCKPLKRIKPRRVRLRVIRVHAAIGGASLQMSSRPAPKYEMDLGGSVSRKTRQIEMKLQGTVNGGDIPKNPPVPATLEDCPRN
jgi:hypothetical protein